MNYEKIALAFDSPNFVDAIEAMIGICVLSSDYIGREISNYKMVALAFVDCTVTRATDLEFLSPIMHAMEFTIQQYYRDLL